MQGCVKVHSAAGRTRRSLSPQLPLVNMHLPDRTATNCCAACASSRGLRRRPRWSSRPMRLRRCGPRDKPWIRGLWDQAHERTTRSHRRAGHPGRWGSLAMPGDAARLSSKAEQALVPGAGIEKVSVSRVALDGQVARRRLGDSFGEEPKIFSFVAPRQRLFRRIDELYLNFECESKWLSCRHICSMRPKHPTEYPTDRACSVLREHFVVVACSIPTVACEGMRSGNRAMAGDFETVVERYRDLALSRCLFGPALRGSGSHGPGPGPCPDPETC